MAWKHSRIALVCGVLGVLILADCSGRQAATPTPAAEQLRGTWQEIEFTSEALAGNLVGDPATRTIRIYLPPGYEDSDESYPVLFGLHGYLETPTWLRGMGATLNDLIANGEARPMILVFPDGDNFFGGSQYLSSPVIGDYETYITHELVDYLDSNYRTLPTREARGIAGCSMGANGALHLALNYPDVFSVAAGASGGYAYETYSEWEQALASYSDVLHPSKLGDIPSIPWYIRVFYAYAAGVAPNPDDQVFHFDLPFELEGDEGRINQEVFDKIRDANVYQDVRHYLEGPDRLNAISIYHGSRDDLVPPEMSRAFSDFLESQNIEHRYVEVDYGHCDSSWDYSDVLMLMSDQLADG